MIVAALKYPGCRPHVINMSDGHNCDRQQDK